MFLQGVLPYEARVAAVLARLQSSPAADDSPGSSLPRAVKRPLRCGAALRAWARHGSMGGRCSTNLWHACLPWLVFLEA